MHRVKVIAIALLSASAFVIAPIVSAADSFGLDATKNEAQKGMDVQFQSDIPTIVGEVIGTALSMISVLFFILMLYGGIRWMLARGNEDQAKKALDTIIAAIIGIIVIIASYAITSFVFKSVGGQAGSGPGDSYATSECNTYYGSVGLSCKSVATCGTDAGFITAVHTQIKQGSLNVSGSNKYIQNLCPGDATIVCCQ